MNNSTTSCIVLHFELKLFIRENSSANLTSSGFCCSEHLIWQPAAKKKEHSPSNFSCTSTSSLSLQQKKEVDNAHPPSQNTALILKWLEIWWEKNTTTKPRCTQSKCLGAFLGTVALAHPNPQSAERLILATLKTRRPTKYNSESQGFTICGHRALFFPHYSLPERTHTCAYGFLCICICVYTYVHIYTQRYTHTDTHTYIGI